MSTPDAKIADPLAELTARLPMFDRASVKSTEIVNTIGVHSGLDPRGWGLMHHPSERSAAAAFVERINAILALGYRTEWVTKPLVVGPADRPGGILVAADANGKETGWTVDATVAVVGKP